MTSKRGRATFHRRPLPCVSFRDEKIGRRWNVALPALRSKTRVNAIYLPKVIRVELDYEIADHGRHQQIDGHRIHSHGGAYLPRAFLLIILPQAAECIFELS